MKEYTMEEFNRDSDGNEILSEKDIAFRKMWFDKGWRAASVKITPKSHTKEFMPSYVLQLRKKWFDKGWDGARTKIIKNTKSKKV
jgi:hypothetical protein